MTTGMKSYLAQVPNGTGGCITVQQLASEGGEKFARRAVAWACMQRLIPLDRVGDTDGVEVFDVVEVDDAGDASVVADEVGNLYSIDMSRGTDL